MDDAEFILVSNDTKIAKNKLFSKGYLPKWSNFSNIGCFFVAVFCTEQIYCSCGFIFGMFLGKKNFHPNCEICIGYRLTKMVDFQNGPIFRVLGVFSSGISHITVPKFAISQSEADSTVLISYDIKSLT